jgi:hypothetical protein
MILLLSVPGFDEWSSRGKITEFWCLLFSMRDGRILLNLCERNDTA